MSGKISSVVSSSEKLDISKMSFEERLQYGAENAVRCMGVTSHDRIFIITDYERENIARRIAVAALDRHADVTIRFLEHYGTRPLTAFPDKLREDLLQTIAELRDANQTRLRIGWNYPRAVNLARWGFAVGYLSEQEAWESTEVLKMTSPSTPPPEWVPVSVARVS